ncbi:type II toxin-antitoxin system HicB family antitoxin [bacterium]|nr:type II toxin-antitoxin system HicB family antitoxin [bacterium]
MRVPVVFEPTSTGFSAYSPDVPGCVAAGGTLDEVRVLMAEALAFHFEGLRKYGEEIPAITSLVEYVDVSVDNIVSDGVD